MENRAMDTCPLLMLTTGVPLDLTSPLTRGTGASSDLKTLGWGVLQLKKYLKTSRNAQAYSRQFFEGENFGMKTKPKKLIGNPVNCQIFSPLN
jgi:hypothetical protein